MGWVTAFAVSGIWGLGTALQAFTADGVAQVLEIKVANRPPSRRDCGFLDCGRTIRFTVLPGLLQGLVEGFVSGWLWDDVWSATAKWPRNYTLVCVINDCVTALVIYPLAFRLHRRPLKQNFLMAAGSATVLRVIIQVICGLLRTWFLFSGFLGSWLPLLLFSTFMYSGRAIPESGMEVLSATDK
eukprot:EG_transcript_20122